MKRTKGRKGQMEMIGLVIIVILLTLGMLFMAQFALKKEPKKKIFVRKGLAYSTMGALMKTTTGTVCYKDDTPTANLTIGRDLIDDCALYKGAWGSYECGGRDSCSFLNQTISYLLNETLGRWNKHYEFKSSLLSGDFVEELIYIKDEEGQGCPGERDSSGLFPINTEMGLVENVLFICD